MDVFCMVKTCLDSDVCPIYTQDDAKQDAWAFAEALGINIVSKPKLPTKYFSFQSAQERIQISKSDWDRLCRQHHPNNFSKCGHPRLPAYLVRRAVLAEYKNDSAAWLACKVGEGCEIWFARLFLPLANHKSFNNIQQAWSVVSKYEDCKEIRALLQNKWIGIIKDGKFSNYYLLKIECDAVMATPETLPSVFANVLGIDRLDGGTSIAEALSSITLEDLEGVDKLACVHRARCIRKNITEVHTESLADVCVKYIISGVGDVTEIQKCIEEDRIKRLQNRAIDLELDPSDFTNSDELLEAVVQKEGEIEMLEDFTMCGLDILEFSYFWTGQVIPEDVVHQESGLHVSVLEPFYETSGILGNPRHWHIEERKNPWGFWGPSVLAERFERYMELKKKLEDEGLELRDDSKICAEYIVHGYYDGPDMDEDGDLECVVAMMIEMDFFFTKSNYSDFMRNLRDSEKAKNLALREFLHAGPDFESRLKQLSPRLQKLVQKGGTQPLSDDEKDLQHFHYYEDDDYESDNSSYSDNF
jgi:hypothetical protein